MTFMPDEVLINFQFFVVSVGSPGLFLLASGVAVMLAGMGLLTLVMEALLRKAVDNEVELAEVI